jgi:hypothetical protein
LGFNAGGAAATDSSFSIARATIMQRRRITVFARKLSELHLAALSLLAIRGKSSRTVRDFRRSFDFVPRFF